MITSEYLAERTASPEVLCEWAEGYRGDNDDGGDGYFDPKKATWSFDRNYPASKFLHAGVFLTRELAKEWLLGEISDFISDGMDYRANDYLKMMVEPIRDAVIVGEANGVGFVWDGFHRVAAILARGDSFIPVIIGRRF